MMVVSIGSGDGDSELCTCLVAGRVRCRVGEDWGDLQSSMCACGKGSGHWQCTTWTR